ncbi:MAG: NPCBM/NEW2 domain-containing protein [Tepidisphaeraceae bacterium]
MSRFLAVILIGLLCLPACAADWVTVFKIDDSQVKGQLLSIGGGNVTLSAPQGGAGSGQVVATDDIARIVFRTPLAAVTPVVAPPAAPSTANDYNATQRPSGFFAAVFGGGSYGGPAPSDPPAPPPLPASRPAGDIEWSVQLAGGDRLQAHIIHWAEDHLTLAFGNEPRATFDIPPDKIVQLWCGEIEARNRAKAKMSAAGASAQDTAYVLRDNDIIAVSGTALGISGDALRFRYEDTERKIALNRLVGVVMASAASTQSPQGLCQCIRLDWGQSLTGQWTSLDASSLSLTFSWGAAAKIPLSAIASIDFRNGRMVYLSDLKPAKVQQTPFFGRVIPYRLDCALDGGPLRLSDGEYAKGIAVHSRCILEYNLHGEFERFVSKVGFDKSALPGASDPDASSAVVRVLADDKPVYENLDARPDQKPADIDVAIPGVNRLVLQVDFANNQDVGGRVDWASARLFRPKSSSVASPAASPAAAP